MRYITLAFVCLALLRPSALAQGTRVDFGKNVIQHKDFDWFYYPTDNFDVYYYKGGKDLAEYTITEANKHLKAIQGLIDYPLGVKLTYIIYNSYSDFRQSNYRVNDELGAIGGKANVQQNKVFIYFDGNHFDLASQIRSGIARVLMNEIISGGSLQERLQNNVLLNVPEWYINGLVQYVAEGWNARRENQLRQGIANDRFRKFKNLSEEEATLIGQSLWRYVYDQYGPAALANIIYIMRANKSIESGYLFVLGKSFSEFYDEWYRYEIKRYNNVKGTEPQGTEMASLKKVFKKGEVLHWDISSRGDKAAVVTNSQGKIRLYVVDIATGKKKKLYTEGYRRAGTYDNNYPLVQWSPVKNELTVIYEKRSNPFYFFYDADEDKTTEGQLIPRVERILSFSYAPNGRTAIMSAIRGGQSDIYTFDFRTQFMRPVTDDIFDDLEPRFVHQGRSIVFTSNRKYASFFSVGEPQFNSNLDIFYIPGYEVNKRSMKRLSNTPADETMPDAIDTAYFSYLTDDNGVLSRNAVFLDSIFQHIMVVASYEDTVIKKNDTLFFPRNDMSAVFVPDSISRKLTLYHLDTYVVYKDTLYVYPLTNYSYNIESYTIAEKGGRILDLVYDEEKYRLYGSRPPADVPASAIARSPNPGYSRRPVAHEERKPNYGMVRKRLENEPGENDGNKPAAPADTAAANRGGAYFQTDFPVPDKGVEDDDARNAAARAALLGTNTRKRFPTPRPYNVTFTPDYVITKFDNSIINTPYLPYNASEKAVYNPTINGMFKLGLSDLFKDYRIMGGFRLLATLRGAQYFGSFENLKGRLDKKVLFYRQGEVKDLGNGTFYRSTSHELRTELRWPFSETSSIRGAAFGRADQTIYLTGERSALEVPTNALYWAGTHLEYVFDNTIAKGLNLYNGARLKLYGDFFNAVNRKQTLLTVVGADIRTYTKLSRQIIWANRLATASSIGTAKVVYFMGGVDNWLLPQYNEENLVDPKQNYVYKAMATNLRGFAQNVRNGGSYAVLNSELRAPLLKYLWNRPFRSQFLENFQVIGFADAGSAWNGINPFSSENAQNKRVIVQGPLRITVNSERDPFVMGYGFGFRSTVLGYFLRLDYAWGIEDLARQPRKIYLSLGMDF